MIFYYSNVLWEAVGFTESAAFVITVITSITNIADHADRDRADRQGRPQAAAARRLDRHGGHAGHDGGHLRHGDQLDVDGECAGPPATLAGPIALIAANLFVVAFGMSWGPVVWVLLGEMFPNRIRAAALGLAAAGQWVANWVITVTFPALRDHAGRRLRLLRAVRGACRSCSSGEWVEETKGKHLEDMHREAYHHEAHPAGALSCQRRPACETGVTLLAKRAWS